MIIPLIFSGALLLTPVKDTVWWNTQGGTVMEHRDQTTARCSLMLYDADGSITFERGASGPTSVTATDPRWRFSDNRKTPVAMQVGDVWLSNHGGSLVIPATGNGSTVAFATNESIDDLLPPAGHILVKTTASDLSIKLLHSKLVVLLSRLQKCQSAISR